MSHRQAFKETVGHLAARWAGAEKRLLRPVFPLLAEGHPVPVPLIAGVAGSTPATVEEALKLGRAGFDAKGQVVELSGLMLDATLHRVEIGDVALFSCCALLSHLVPQLLERAVRVESVDPVSRRLVRLVITGQGITEAEPAGAVASLVVTEATEMAGDIGTYFCRHVHHFVSSESAREFVAAEPRRYMLAIEELHEAARLLYREAWAA